MNLHLGTSGFSYPAWKGRFYPPKMKATEMLAFYAARFSAVEINASFYRMPSESMLAAWLPQVPEGFRFALKAPQRITHQLRLVGAEETLKRFLDVAQTLGASLGPLLFQLPPNLKKDLPRLGAFLDLLPRGGQFSAEFRHASWFDAETEAVLRERGIALCWEEADALQSPFTSTAAHGYLRLRRLAYGDAELRAWVRRIQAQPWKDAFVFFKHEDEATGPAFAARFRALWDATG